MTLCIFIPARKNGKEGRVNLWRNMPAKLIPLPAFPRAKHDGLSLIGRNCVTWPPLAARETGKLIIYLGVVDQDKIRILSVEKE